MGRPRYMQQYRQIAVQKITHSYKVGYNDLLEITLVILVSTIVNKGEKR